MSPEPEKLQCLDGGICFIYRLIFNISVIDVVLQAQHVLQQARSSAPVAAAPEPARCLRRLHNALDFVDRLADELSDSTVLKWLLGQVFLLLSVRKIQHCCQTLDEAMSQQQQQIMKPPAEQAAAEAAAGGATAAGSEPSTVVSSHSCPPHSDRSVAATAATAAATAAAAGGDPSGLHSTLLPAPHYEPHIPLKVFRWKDLAIANKPIGSGAYGWVYPAWLKGTQVAVKQLVLPQPDDVLQLQLQQRMTKDEQRRYLIGMMEREAQMMAAGHGHPHILGCVGVCYDTPAIVMELCKAGSLHMNLKKYKAQQQQQQQQEPDSRNSSSQQQPQQQLLTPATVVKLLHQAAAAMACLHSSAEDTLTGHGLTGDGRLGCQLALRSLLHCDVRAQNLLLQGNLHRPDEWTLKVADFGLARWSGPDGETAQSASITHPLWVAPEVIDSVLQPAKQQQQQQQQCSLNGHRELCQGALDTNGSSYSSQEHCISYTVSKASDVFSFGCVLWEVLTGRVPYLTDSVSQRQFEVWAAGGHKGVMQWPSSQQLLPGFDDQLLLQLQPLFEACNNPDPSKRPSFESIQFWLAQLLKSRKSRTAAALSSPAAAQPAPPLPPPAPPAAAVPAVPGLGFRLKAAAMAEVLQPAPAAAAAGPKAKAATQFAAVAEQQQQQQQSAMQISCQPSIEQPMDELLLASAATATAAAAAAAAAASYAHTNTTQQLTSLQPHQMTPMHC